MSDETAKLCFIDTNIWFYSFVEQDDPNKSRVARESIRAVKPVVSTQVVNEVCVNLLKKARSSEDMIAELIASFYDAYGEACSPFPSLMSSEHAPCGLVGKGLKRQRVNFKGNVPGTKSNVPGTVCAG